MKRKLSILLTAGMIMGATALANDNFAEHYQIVYGETEEITRAEMAISLSNMLNMKNYEIAVPEEEKFHDVPKTHPAYNAANLIKQLGIAEGYGENNFGPNDNLTYEQAIKMLVCALGYNTVAIERGGYSMGYISLASELGITNGVDFITTDNVTKENLTKLINNIANIPVMEKIGFGSNPEYAIMNGKDGNTLMTFYDKYFGN